MPSLASTSTRATSARSALPLLALPAQPGGVDELEDRAVALEHRVDRVARGAWHLGDDRPLLADERVQQRGLAHVRATEDRHADRLLTHRHETAAGQPVDHLVEEIAGAVAVQRRQRERLAEPEPVELQRVDVPPRVVQLVGQDEHRLV
jgi:hypothetical protein